MSNASACTSASLATLLPPAAPDRRTRSARSAQARAAGSPAASNATWPMPATGTARLPPPTRPRVAADDPRRPQPEPPGPEEDEPEETEPEATEPEETEPEETEPEETEVTTGISPYATSPTSADAHLG